jgi:sugar-specific transcriptional regulator TrmB
MNESIVEGLRKLGLTEYEANNFSLLALKEPLS